MVDDVDGVEKCGHGDCVAVEDVGSDGAVIVR
jgi:hypothetical protein